MWLTQRETQTGSKTVAFQVFGSEVTSLAAEIRASAEGEEMALGMAALGVAAIPEFGHGAQTD